MAFNGCNGVGPIGTAHNEVHGDQFNTNYNLDTSAKVIKLVSGYTAANAFHNSEQRFPPPNCLPGTRVKTLDHLNKWITEESTRRRVCWVHGRAGVGKSAIMQNLSEAHARLPPSTERPYPRLAASFFFSRNDPTRDKLDPFVATIIFQFLTSEPLRTVLGPLIIEAVRSNPKIFETTSENQFEKLVLEPCSKVDAEELANLPNLVVIDGLDECILMPSQERLLAMIREAITQCCLIFLVASRPEPRICRAFEHALFTSRLHRLAIGDSAESSRDITTYLHHQFAQLQDTHHALSHLNTSWPGEEAVWELVKRACGQFIFAVTVMKYLESDDALPIERLDDILRIRADDLPKSPYPDLDLLYRQILSACPNWDEVQEVLRLIITMPHHNFHGTRKPISKWSSPTIAFIRGPVELPCTPMCIETILGLKPGKVQTLLFKLHAVIEVPKYGDSASIHIPHASFTEFLSDPMRSQNYHVKQHTRLKYCDLVVRAYLQVISINSHKVHRSLPSQLSWNLLGPYEDFSLFAVFELSKTLPSPSADLLAALNQFNPYSFATGLLNSQEWYEELGTWAKDSMKWAKSLTQPPQTFISRMESFLHSFCVASPPNTAAEELARAVIHLEECLYGLSSWYCLWFGKRPSNENNIYILPPDQQLPSSWSCYIVTCEKAETVKSLLESLSYWSDNKLGRDIREGTYNSVGRRGFLQSRADWLKTKHDLYTLKKLVAQRRQEFGLAPWPCTPPVTEDDLLDGGVNSFRRADAILGDDSEDSNAMNEAAARAKEANVVMDWDAGLVSAHEDVTAVEGASSANDNTTGETSSHQQRTRRKRSNSPPLLPSRKRGRGTGRQAVSSARQIQTTSTLEGRSTPTRGRRSNQQLASKQHVQRRTSISSTRGRSSRQGG